MRECPVLFLSSVSLKLYIFLYIPHQHFIEEDWLFKTTPLFRHSYAVVLSKERRCFSASPLLNSYFMLVKGRSSKGCLSYFYASALRHLLECTLASVRLHSSNSRTIRIVWRLQTPCIYAEFKGFAGLILITLITTINKKLTTLNSFFSFFPKKIW